MRFWSILEPYKYFVDVPWYSVPIRHFTCHSRFCITSLNYYYYIFMLLFREWYLQMSICACVCVLKSDCSQWVLGIRQLNAPECSYTALTSWLYSVLLLRSYVVHFVLICFQTFLFHPTRHKKNKRKPASCATIQYIHTIQCVCVCVACLVWFWLLVNW